MPVVTFRIDYKKIKEKKDLNYLEHWFCPIEMARKSGADTAPRQGTSLHQYIIVADNGSAEPQRPVQPVT